MNRMFVLSLAALTLAACGGGGRSGGGAAPAVTNRAPTALITAQPSSGPAPLDVALSAVASSDTDGKISSYRFSVADTTLGTDAQTQHTFVEPGTYAVTLTVTDDDGATATASTTVTVT